jgi:antitoxin VapB
MARTRVFKSGNSQAVRIPAELAYAETDIDLEITRHGDVITIFPARDSLKDVVAALRRMAKPPRVEKREPIEIPERRRDRAGR